MKTPEINIVVLASGLSSRMGEQKLLLPLKGKTLLDHVLIKAKSSCISKLLTVVPAKNKEIKKIVFSHNARLICNFQPENGIGSSLALGVKNLPKTTDAVIVLLGDQPEIQIEDINRITDYFLNHCSSLANPGTSGTIIQTCYKDKRCGHPVLFSKEFFQAICQLNGDSGGKHIIRSNPRNLIKIHSPNIYPCDIDTPNDYQKLLIRNKV
ncbi:nucleotidyltransferase family protein [Scopulibacillus cellulosilyticus]|uniref:NTP transferase domain-containing protein n=1 Tax=Scopulibacillus cellulosilyticus TaxID=2665665 RepID=A0ABW2PTV2_9BACL